MIIYGIKNCDTVKKAINWMRANNIEFAFHDFKKHGISQSKLEEWAAQTGWEALLNKKGTNWRNLKTEEKLAVVDQQTALRMLAGKPGMIKRPVLETPKGILLGFEATKYQTILD